MGFDINCIVGSVDDELICPICTDVLECPLQSMRCEHTFCRECIVKWMNVKSVCPVDRSELLSSHLAPASRLMRNMLGRLQIKCPFAEHECPMVMPLHEFRAHIEACQYNPKAMVECKSCSMKVPKNEMPQHNCILELRKLLQSQGQVLKELRDGQLGHGVRIGGHGRELELLQFYVATMRSTSPVMRNVGEQLDRYAVSHWCAGLPHAHVINWGSVISTPNNQMHLLVRDSLRDSGCPMHLLNTMVEHCHEERWPTAIASLDNRRANQHQMTEYVARFIKSLSTGQPCVCVFGDDNYHMPDNMRPVLGMTMIFVDSVEEMSAEI